MSNYFEAVALRTLSAALKLKSNRAWFKGSNSTLVCSVICGTVNSVPTRTKRDMLFMLCRMIVVLLFLLSGGRAVLCEEDRIWMDATINGQKVHLALDTGTSQCVLFRPTANRLGL